MRTLQTIDGLGPTASNTVVLAMPIDVLESLGSLRTPSGAGPRVQARSLRRREAIICNDTAASEPYSDQTCAH